MTTGSSCMRTGPCRGRGASLGCRGPATVPAPPQRRGGTLGTVGKKGHTYGARHPETPSRVRDLVLGFICRGTRRRDVPSSHGLSCSGAPSLAPSRVYVMRGVPPLACPPSSTRCSGRALGPAVRRGRRHAAALALLLLGCSFGVLGPVLASWFVVAPAQGHPHRGRMGYRCACWRAS